MAVTQYIGARYVPMFAEPVEWSSTVTYEPLTMVTYQGATYTSRQAVPIGIDIGNEQYWVCSGNYNAQTEIYRQETQDALKQLDTAIGTATDAASAAKTSETNAATSATAAAESEANAKTYMGNALVNANTAEQAAENAASDEIKASAAATTATEQASAAANSATAAEESATNAAASAAKVPNMVELTNGSSVFHATTTGSKKYIEYTAQENVTPGVTPLIIAPALSESDSAYTYTGSTTRPAYQVTQPIWYQESGQYEDTWYIEFFENMTYANGASGDVRTTYHVYALTSPQ